MSHSGEGGAYGAALVAGAGVGIWSRVEEAVKVLEVGTKTSPIPKNVEGYDRLFKIYRGLYSSLKSTFGQISEIYSR